MTPNKQFSYYMNVFHKKDQYGEWSVEIDDIFYTRQEAIDDLYRQYEEHGGLDYVVLNESYHYMHTICHNGDRNRYFEDMRDWIEETVHQERESNSQYGTYEQQVAETYYSTRL